MELLADSYSATATADGEYVFVQIPPAKYTIVVTATGFGEQKKTAELLVNQPATIDFALTVQASTVTVDVSAAAQTLNTSDASLGNSVDNATIQALPSEERNIPDLLSLQPGVVFLPAANIGANDPRSGAVNGGRSDQGNVTIDGIDDNDQVNGYAFTGVLRQTQDSIEEFRVVTGNSNADSGRSSGAQISMVTKSGTNKIHGAAYEYNRNGVGVANDWFVKQGQLNSNQANIPGKLIRNIYGADLGMPHAKGQAVLLWQLGGLPPPRISLRNAHSAHCVLSERPDRLQQCRRRQYHPVQQVISLLSILDARSVTRRLTPAARDQIPTL